MVMAYIGLNSHRIISYYRE